MKKALVHEGRICQFGEPFPVAPPLQWVDVPDDTTTEHTWDGEKVVKPDPEPEQRRIVPKRVIIDRLEAMGLADAAENALHQLPAAVRQRWYAMSLSDGPYHDDEDTVALLEAIEADPEVVLAP